MEHLSYYLYAIVLQMCNVVIPNFLYIAKIVLPLRCMSTCLGYVYSLNLNVHDFSISSFSKFQSTTLLVLVLTTMYFWILQSYETILPPAPLTSRSSGSSSSVSLSYTNTHTPYIAMYFPSGDSNVVMRLRHISCE